MNEDHEIIAINFWKFSNFQIKRMLQEYWNILLLIHNSLEFNQFIEFFTRIPDPGKVVYISLTKTNETIKPYLKNIYTKIYIIDCVSCQLFETKETENSYFEPMPSNLKEMVGLIDKFIQKLGPNFIILDSLSQFIDFSSMSISKSRELYEFLDHIKEKYSATPYRFIILYDNTMSKELVQMPQASVDIILKFEVITGRVNWGE